MPEYKDPLKSLRLGSAFEASLKAGDALTRATSGFPEVGSALAAYERATGNLGGFGHMDLSPIESILEAQRVAEAASRPLRDLQRTLDRIGAPLRELQEALRGPSAAYEETMRALQWSGSIGIADQFRWSLLPDGIGDALREHRERMSAIGSTIEALHIDMALPTISSPLITTQAKLSVFAGVRDSLGFSSPFEGQAYRSLFGEWHTRPDLPQRFWNDEAYRRSLYREADVDDGLAEAKPEEILDLIVDSGFAPGRRDNGGTIVTFRHVGLVAVISSKNLETDAHQMVCAFEDRLRKLVSDKMEARYGIEWMKNKSPGKTFQNARLAREKAYKSGEPRAPLISFTHLGDLKEIIRQTDVWEALFEVVFRHRDDFCREIDKIIAYVRNPNSHSRKLDGTRFLEIVRTINNLLEQIEDDGEWLVDAQKDF